MFVLIVISIIVSLVYLGTKGYTIPGFGPVYFILSLLLVIISSPIVLGLVLFLLFKELNQK